MFFSGLVNSYKCTACHAQFTRAVPTSLLPMAIVVAVATYFWDRVLRQFVFKWWISIPASICIALASLLLLYLPYDLLTTRNFRRRICPKCKAPLQHTGGGHYDGLIPTPGELLIYALAIALAITFAKLDGQ